MGGTADVQSYGLSDCLKTSYDARIDTIRDLSPLSDLLPTRGLYRPHLSLNKAPALCAAFQAAEQEAFLSADPYPTVVGKSWPGLATAWHITQPIHQAWGFADDQSMEHSIVDLDGDGTPEVITPYPDQGHQLNTDIGWSWQRYRLARFPSQQDFSDFQAQWAASPAPTKERPYPPLPPGAELLTERTTFDKSGVFRANGKVYYVDDRTGPQAAWEPARLFLLPKTGPLTPLRQVERAPSNWHQLAEPAGLTEVFTLLQQMLGTPGVCDWGSKPERLEIATSSRLRALIRPWSLDRHAFTPRHTVDEELQAWAKSNPTNLAIYDAFRTAEPAATAALARWYALHYGIPQARALAIRTLDRLTREHFRFVTGGRPTVRPHPLIEALSDGAPLAEIKTLLQQTDINSPIGEDNPFHQGDVPLVFALNRPELVTLMLDLGAQVDAATPFGKTPLMYAAQGNHIAAARLLLTAGADVTRRTRSLMACGFSVHRGDRTALHYAAENAGPEMIRLLIQAGADPHALDSDDQGSPPQSPQDYLTRNTPLTPSQRAEALALLR